MLQNLASLDFAKFSWISITPTHSETKFYTSANKTHSSNLHLGAESIIVAQIPMNLRGQKFYLLTICFLVLYLYDCIEWQLWSSKDKAVMQLLTWITFVNTFMHAYQIHLWLFWDTMLLISILLESNHHIFVFWIFTARSEFYQVLLLNSQWRKERVYQHKEVWIIGSNYPQDT